MDRLHLIATIPLTGSDSDCKRQSRDRLELQYKLLGRCIGGLSWRMKKAGISEIARLANVSIGTVDRALHGRSGIRESTRDRILTIANSLRYKPNLAARALSRRQQTVRIAICVPREIHFYFNQLLEGLQAEARRFEHLGVETIYHPTARLGMHEPETVREVISEHGIRALIIAPGNPQILNSVIDEAEKKDIRVICVDTDAPESSRSTVVCVDGTVSGMLSGELLGRFLCPKSSVVVTTGMLQAEDHRKKVDGFRKVFPQVCEGGKVMEVIEDHEDRDIALEKCLALLKERGDLSGIYVSTANCLPVCRALKVCGLAGKIKVVATELFAEMIPYFENATILASVTGRAHAQGQTAMHLTIDHLLHHRPLPSHRYLLPHIAMRSNLHLFPEVRNAVMGVRDL
jgi:LacI family transcriptional regulator, galactose operon repressor